MKKLFLIALIFDLFLISNAIADDLDTAKKNAISRLTSSIAGGMKNIIDGEGDTEVQITAGEDYQPEFSIMSVRPLAVHPEVDAWFVQLQLNQTKIRGSGRYSINTGVGYRKLSDNKNHMIGMNVFLDYDEKGNTRSSVGFELRASAFEAIMNYYQGLSGGQTVGDHTERTLDGKEISIVGELPYLPWANIVANAYEWRAEKNSKNSVGHKLSLELTLTPNFIVETGADDNNLSGGTNFVKAYFVFPARERAAASNNLIGETAFSKGDMSLKLLSKVRRTNKQIIESEKNGFVVARSN